MKGDIKMKLSKSYVITPFAVVTLSLVCWFGFDFLKSWHQHYGHIVGNGVFFALSLVLLASAFMFRDSRPQSDGCAKTSSEVQSGATGGKQDSPPH